MERFSLAEGRGWLTVQESGGRAQCAAELPDDGKGLYKGYLYGGGGRAPLGAFLPEGGVLKLRRTLSLDELRRRGVWPPTRAAAELAFAAGGGPPPPPGGWRWESQPARRMGERLLARAAGEGKALYRPEPEGFSLAFPFSDARAFPLTPLFCFAEIQRLGEEFYAVFPFRPGGCPRSPYKAAGMGQTREANHTKEETHHGESDYQGADRPVRSAQF